MKSFLWLLQIVAEMVRNLVMAYVYFISKLVRNILHGRCGVIICYGSRKKEVCRETTVDQLDVDIGKTADAVVQTEYVCEELSTKITRVSLIVI